MHVLCIGASRFAGCAHGPDRVHLAMHMPRTYRQAHMHGARVFIGGRMRLRFHTQMYMHGALGCVYMCGLRLGQCIWSVYIHRRLGCDYASTCVGACACRARASVWGASVHTSACVFSCRAQVHVHGLCICIHGRVLVLDHRMASLHTRARGCSCHTQVHLHGL